MARNRKKSSAREDGGRSRLRALPWAALLKLGVTFGERWRALSPKERTRITDLLRSSRGRLGNLTAKERGELRKLVGKLDLKGIGRELVPLARGRRKRR